MKTSHIDAAHRAESVRRNRPYQSQGGFFAGHLDGEAAVPAGFETPAAVMVGSILTIQETLESPEGHPRARAKAYGDAILERLDSLRLDLLSGGVPAERLIGLAQTLRAKRHLSGDGRLDAVIEEIELRAEVELAKLTRRR